MLLENPYPSTISSIEDKVIEAKEMEEGVSLVSRQEILPYRHCSLHDSEEVSHLIGRDFMNSVDVQMIISDIKEKKVKKSIFGRRGTTGTGATDSTTLASMKSVSFAPASFSASSSSSRPNENRVKSNRFCLIVVDKTITIDHRILISLLLAVFLLFFVSIIISVFLLSVYIWLN